MNIINDYAAQQILAEHPGARRRGFAESLRCALKTAATDMNDDEDDADALWPIFVPDWYQIDTDKQEIVLWEVEDTHTISEAKLRNIVKWWFAMDTAYHQWNVILIVTDRYGYNWRQLDLAAAYLVILNNDVHLAHAKKLQKKTPPCCRLTAELEKPL